MTCPFEATRLKWVLAGGSLRQDEFASYGSSAALSDPALRRVPRLGQTGRGILLTALGGCTHVCPQAPALQEATRGMRLTGRWAGGPRGHSSGAAGKAEDSGGAETVTPLRRRGERH